MGVGLRRLVGVRRLGRIWFLRRVVVAHRGLLSSIGTCLRACGSSVSCAPGLTVAFITILSVCNRKIPDIEPMSKKAPSPAEVEQ